MTDTNATQEIPREESNALSPNPMKSSVESIPDEKDRSDEEEEMQGKKFVGTAEVEENGLRQGTSQAVENGASQSEEPSENGYEHQTNESNGVPSFMRIKKTVPDDQASHEDNAAQHLEETREEVEEDVLEMEKREFVRKEDVDQFKRDISMKLSQIVPPPDTDEKYESTQDSREAETQSLLRQIQKLTEAQDHTVSAHRAFRSQVSAELESLREQSRSREMEFERLQDTYAEEKERFRSEVSSHSNASKKMKSKYNKAQSELNTLKSQMSSHKTEFEKQLSAKNSEVKQCKARMEELESSLSKNAKSLEECKEREKRLEQEKIDFIIKHKKSMEKDLHKDQQDRMDVESQLAEITKQLKHKSSELRKKHNDIKYLNSVVESNNREKEEAVRKKQEYVEILKRRTQSETEALEQCEGMKSRIDTLETKLKNIQQENRTLHESLRKKSEREKSFKERERRLHEREKAVKVGEQKISKKMERAEKKANSSYSNRSYKSSKKSPTQLRAWDPCDEYRSLLPWHWVSVVLFVLLFLMIMFS